MPSDPGPTADHALRRYLASGAPEALAELFDTAAEPLWRVALHLLGDAARAEDALQETFLAVIEARGDGREAPPREALPWLTGILHNRVRRQRRDGARIPDPGRIEESLDRLTAEDPLTAAERRELVAAVERELHALPETYRPVLRLALQHGLAPHEIAATLERAPVTVRVQLSRGLALLRERLGPGLAGSLLAVGLSLGAASAQVPAAVRSAVLEAARLALPATAGAAATVLVASIGTTLLMKKLALSIVALVAVAATTWMLWDGGAPPHGDPGAEAREPADPRSADAGLPANDGTSESGTADEALRVAVEPSPAPAEGGRRYGQVRVRLTWKDHGTPAAGVGVSAYRWDAGNPHMNRVEGVSDLAGEVLLERVLVGKVDVRTDHESVDVEITEAGEEVLAEIAVGRHATLTGRVVDHEGRPVAGATILTSQYFNHSSCFAVATADAQGRFEIPFGAACYIGARAPGHVPSHYFLIPLDAGQTEEVTIPLRGPAGRLIGRVVDDTGEPIHGARIQHGSSGAHVNTTDADQLVGEHVGSPRAVTAPHPWLATDAQGRFVLDGLPPGRARVRVRALDHGEVVADVEIEAGEDTATEVVLPDHAVVEGRVVGADGAPAKVRIIAGDERYADFGYCRTESGADGRFRLDSLKPGRVSLRIDHKDAGRASTTLTLAPGEVGRWDPVLEAIPTISGRVVDALGTPRVGYRVHAKNLDMTARHWGNAKTDAEGRFELGGLKNEVHRVEVYAPGSDFIACHAAGDATPGGEALEIVVDEAELPSAWIRGAVLGPGGEPLVGAQLTLRHDNFGYFHDCDAETGAFAIGPLPPRAVRLTTDAGRLGDVDLGAWRLEPHQRIDIGQVHLAEPGRIEVQLGYEVGERSYSGIQLTRPDGSFRSHVEPDSEGRATLEPIPPGRYVLHAVGSQRSRCVPVTVRSGETARVELPIDDRPERALTIRRSSEDEAMFTARILDADGVFDGGASMPPTKARETTMRVRTPTDGRAFTVILFDRNMEEITRKTFAADDELVLPLE